MNYYCNVFDVLLQRYVSYALAKIQQFHFVPLLMHTSLTFLLSHCKNGTVFMSQVIARYTISRFALLLPFFMHINFHMHNRISQLSFVCPNRLADIYRHWVYWIWYLFLLDSAKLYCFFRITIMASRMLHIYGKYNHVIHRVLIDFQWNVHHTFFIGFGRFKVFYFIFIGNVFKINWFRGNKTNG